MDNQERVRLLYQEVEALAQQEKEIRKKYNMGDRYKAIASRLNGLLQYVQQKITLPKEENVFVSSVPMLSEGERYVFVHLFNAKGKVLMRWEAMLSPRLLYEYSVNRPVYAEQGQVEAYIRSRQETDEHAFFMIKIAQSDVIQDLESAVNHDLLGQALLKLKEGALKEEGLVYFFHQRQRYVFVNGRLVNA